MEYNEYDIRWFRVNYSAGVNMHSYATYDWLSIKQRQADVRGGGIRDNPKERLRRRLLAVLS